MILGLEIVLFIVLLELSLRVQPQRMALLTIGGVVSILVGLLNIKVIPAGIAIMISAVGVYQISLVIYKALADNEGSRGWSQFKGLFDKAKDSIE